MSTEHHPGGVGAGQPASGRVVVIGGGAIGLSSAYHLARKGLEVTLLERGECGQGASWGNAGWIVPSLVHPFNAPGAIPDALRAMLDPHSPIALRQIPTPGLARWGLRFAKASRPQASHASLRALSAWASTAAEDITALAAELAFELHRTGLLVPFRSIAALEAYQASHAHIEELGYKGRIEVLDAAAVKAREPSLAEEVVGGLHLLDELSVRPASLNTALARGLADLGGEIAEHEKVLSIKPTGSGQWQVHTEGRVLAADAVVVAAGEDTASLVRGNGVRIPLQSGRGCSVTLPPQILTLRQPLKIAEHRVACTPFANGEVRISGTFDLVRPGAGTARGRMRSVLDLAATHLPALRDRATDLDVWSGARPCTPDSVPIVGPVGQVPGLFAATGHGTLGITLAVATGRTITAQVSAALARTAPKGLQTP